MGVFSIFNAPPAPHENPSKYRGFRTTSHNVSYVYSCKRPVSSDLHRKMQIWAVYRGFGELRGVFERFLGEYHKPRQTAHPVGVAVHKLGLL